MGVRMRHPDLEGEITVAASAVPFHAEAGWQAVEGQQDMGEVWPAEVQRFGGQPQVRLAHPGIEGEPITVAESAVPFHREKGWFPVDDAGVGEEQAAGKGFDASGLAAWTLEELKEEARGRGLPVSGTKAELAERLSEPQEAPAGSAGQTSEEGEQ